MLLVLPFSSALAQSSQVYISELWIGAGGQTAVFYHNVSKTDDLGNVYVAGSTINTSGNHDIIVQKFDKDGDLLWQQTYNGAADMDDMAADLFIDNQYNVYVTGAITVNSQNSFDLGVLKYNSSGLSQWQYVYNGAGSSVPYDAGTAITGDNNGSIYVTGGSFGTTTMADYVTARIDASNGSEIWLSSYDHDELNDLSAKIAVKLGQVIVSGASQISTSPEAYELATITYAASNGNFVSERRTSGSATDGVDEVYDLVIDDDGFIYIAGAVKNTGNGFDIKLYKLDDDLNIVWEVDFDGYEAEDKAHGVAVNEEGEIYLTGFVTHPTQGRNIVTLKYDTAGTLLWNREYHGEIYGDDEGIQLVIDHEGRAFVAGEIRNGEYSDYVTIGYYSDGSPFGQAIFDGPQGLDDRPTGMAIDLDGNIIVTGLSEEPGGELRNRTVKYSVYDKPIDPVIIDSVPSHNANELLIRFDRSVMNYAAVDNKAFTAGQLSDFVKPQVIDSMNSVVDFDFEKLNTYKVFLGMTTADSLSVTRLGDTVRVRDFWATLAVYIPDQYNLEQTIDSLNTLSSQIKYSHLNPFGQLFGDPYYDNGNQPGLNNPDYGINIEEAWAIQKGTTNTRVGIYDSGINWRHEDFGNGTQEGTKIANGWDFIVGLSPFVQGLPDFHGHGTAVASIVGALRNNNKGIAGIAGGDILEDGNPGASLFSWNIGTHLDFDPLNPEHTEILHSIAAPAIVFTSISTPNWGNPMDVQNHSWGSYFSTFVLRDAVRTAFENQIVFVAASGNEGENSPRYPASYLDEHVLKIGASNSDPTGSVWSNSNYGYNLDLVAPGTFDTYSACDNDDNSGYSYSENGTSFATAHVSGCAALLISEHSLTNSNQNYPNNLAPEDIESIFSIYATNLGAPGYDILSGHGILNCGNSLQKVALPDYCVEHYVAPSQNYTLVESGVLVSVEESVNNVTPGLYYANRYEVTANETISLEQNEQLEGAWPRYSSSKSYSQDPLIYDRNIYSFNYSTNGQDVNIACEGYCWELTSNIAGTTLTNTWAPYNPSELEFAYSLHLKHDNVTSSEQKPDFQFTIFPNPTKSNINLLLDESLLGANEVKIVSLTGKIVLHQRMDDRSHNQSIEIDVSPLSSGLYVVEVSDRTGNSNRKKLLISK